MSNIADDLPKAGGFSSADLQRITASTFVERIDYHAEIDSTNDRGLAIAGRPGWSAPLLVLAESQTRGRGRGANTWWARSGALTFSLLIHTDAARLPVERWPQVSLTTGLAVCEAIEPLLDEPAIELKWPNDVFVQRRKACGILIEAPPHDKRTLILGIGINVNNSAEGAPASLRPAAIALCDAAGRGLDRTEVLIGVLNCLQERLGWIGHRDDELRKRWRERCLLTGRRVTLQTPTRDIEGLCRGIDDQGALLIETSDQTERCFAGTITSYGTERCPSENPN
jgi:BirA family biotin operon repressor/biotin-[acetyl-CoA-carboxylase] ligase